MTELRKLYIEGPAGYLECLLRVHPSPRAAVVVAHPHPMHGGTMDNAGDFVYSSDYSDKDRVSSVGNIIQASVGEASMMARCTGKTNLHNLEPEDIRSITLASAEAAGIPLVGSH